MSGPGTRSSPWGALAPLVLTLGACASAPAASPSAAVAPVPPIGAAEARERLERLSPNKVQLWVVVHIRAHKHLRPDGSVDEARLIEGALRDVDAVVNGGGDVLVLINARAELPVYERVITAVRARHPTFPLAISALAYGPENLTEGIRLAEKFSADAVWCEVVPGEGFEYEDDGDVYKRAVTTDPDFANRAIAAASRPLMHVAGVRMKYTRPLPDDTLSYEQAVQAAQGRVHGIIVTGPKTGVRADAERIAKARASAGGYPVGLASGVSVENIAEVIEHIDFAIVGTSLKVPDDPLRTSQERVSALRAEMSRLGGGPRPGTSGSDTPPDAPGSRPASAPSSRSAE